MPNTPTSPWRIPLVREIAAILAIKLVLLMAIKTLWFDAPTVPPDGSSRVGSHLLGDPKSPRDTRPEENPR